MSSQNTRGNGNAPADRGFNFATDRCVGKSARRKLKNGSEIFDVLW